MSGSSKCWVGNKMYIVDDEVMEQVEQLQAELEKVMAQRECLRLSNSAFRGDLKIQEERSKQLQAENKEYKKTLKEIDIKAKQLQRWCMDADVDDIRDYIKQALKGGG